MCLSHSVQRWNVRRVGRDRDVRGVPRGQIQHRRRHDLRHDLHVQVGLHHLRLGRLPDLHRMQAGTYTATGASCLNCTGPEAGILQNALLIAALVPSSSPSLHPGLSGSLSAAAASQCTACPTQQRQHVGVLHVHVLCRLLQLQLRQHASLHQYV